MSSLRSRRAHSTQAGKGKEPASDDHDHRHDHANGHAHSHSHSGSFFGAMTHTHGPAEDGHGHDAEQIMQALQQGGVFKDRGSRITIIGLLANIGLTASKGAAGWYMNSASLLADAGHSLSDLLGDFVTLLCWKLSRRPPSERYPYGFGKFEVLGTMTVSLMLTGGALGIGFHSWTLLMDALQHTAVALPSGAIHDVLMTVSNTAQSVPAVLTEHAHAHAHGHNHGLALDPNAAWFAAISVVGKEWLYRVTKRVADDERSPVLYANAIHHRSDAYSSTVALLAILGTWWFPHLPLDPIGGIIVSILIIKQGWGVLVNALHQLTDGSVSVKTRQALEQALAPLLPAQSEFSNTHSLPSPPPTPPLTQVTSHTKNLFAIHDLRAMRAGALMFVDLVADVPRTLSIEEASAVEAEIRRVLKKARKEVAEVRVKFRPVNEQEIICRHNHGHTDH